MEFFLYILRVSYQFRTLKLRAHDFSPQECVELVRSTLPGSTGTVFTNHQYSVHLIHVAGSSVAGMILQDQDTLVNLEQVSKFNSTNQNVSTSDAGTYTGVFSD